MQCCALSNELALRSKQQAIAISHARRGDPYQMVIILQGLADTPSLEGLGSCLRPPSYFFGFLGLHVSLHHKTPEVETPVRNRAVVGLQVVPVFQGSFVRVLPRYYPIRLASCERQHGQWYMITFRNRVMIAWTALFSYYHCIVEYMLIT